MLMLLMLMAFALYGKSDLSFALGVDIFYDNFDYILDDTFVNSFSCHAESALLMLLAFCLPLLDLHCIFDDNFDNTLDVYIDDNTFDDTVANTYVNTF